MKLKYLLGLVLVLSCQFSSQVAFAEDEEQAEETKFRARTFVNLTLGIEQDEKLPPLPENIEFKGDFRRIVTASHSKELNVLRMTPKAEGFATLTIHDKKTGKVVAEFRIDVKKSRLDKVVKEIRALLGDIEGITIKVVNNKVVVDGQILLPRDLSRIYNVIQQFGGQLGVPRGGFWKEVLNSDSVFYGGSGLGNSGGLEANHVISHGRPYSLFLTLPPLSVLFLKSEI
jgi:pilus assembly protein CpaC